MDYKQNGTKKRSGEKTGNGTKQAYTAKQGTGIKTRTGEKPGFGVISGAHKKQDSGARPGYSSKHANGRKPYRSEQGKPFTRNSEQKAMVRPPDEGMPARRLALKVIRQVVEEGAYASFALDRVLEKCTLPGADRRLVSRLAYDTIDHMIYLDHALSQVMAKPDTDIRLKNILRLGACQILIEDRIPESAATNTCVQLCIEAGLEGLKGVCNGILRNLVRKKEELVFPDPENEPDRACAIRYSLPEWLWRKLKEEYGRETAEKIASFRSLNPGWTLRPNLMRFSEEEFENILQKKTWEKRKADIPYAWTINGALNIGEDTDYQNGNYSIITGGSMLACLAMDAGRGKQILDCCAAPGGKTCFLAELMAGTGRVQAWDIHEHRVSLIEAQARRLGLENIRPMIRDATVRRNDLVQRMDAVLLDAPCTGIGMLAEKPDIKLRVSEKNLQELVDIQKRLLDTVCDYVKTGGILVYSTCSILKEENEEQISDFVNRHPEFAVDPLPETIPDKYRQYEKTGLQLLEWRDGVEGFFICRLRRKDC